MAKVQDEFATDTEGAETGKWFTLRAAKEGSTALRVRLRSVTSKKYRNEEQKLQRSYRGKYAAGQGYLSIDDQDEYEVKLCAQGVLTAWEGVDDNDGKPIPFTHANAIRILTEFPALRREIFVWAKMDDNYKPPEVLKAEQDAIVKN